MKWNHLAAGVAFAAMSLLLFACGGAVDDSNGEEATPDGVVKKNDPGGKGDRWDYLNDPERFQTELTYGYSELKSESEGDTENEVWPATYWPLYKDGINQRWQGEDTLSPAEKYDRAFNDWTPEGGFSEFMGLQPFNPDTCEWDDAYYESLGPAAREMAKDGNWKAHNGRDDDGDGVGDSEECGYGEDADYDGVETWFGLCHAWAPASILENEPKTPVTVEGSDGEDVTFAVSDLKALIIDQYDRSESYMIGGRCNSSDVERDDNGRIPDDKCRDVNAGTFHVIMTNFLGLQGRPIIEDRVYDYEVWNQPIVGYTIEKQEKRTLEEVEQMLNTAEERDENSTPETDEEIAQVLYGANTLSKDELVEDAGLREDRASSIVDYRSENGSFDDLSALEGEVGTRTLSRLLDYAYEQGWVEDDSSVYSYNEDAEEFVEVEMDVDYITESSPSTDPLADRLEEYTRNDHYRYILELGGNGEVIGGEWVGRSVENHPDFLWLPTGAGGGNRNIDLAKVRELLEKSRNDGNADSPGEEDSSTDEPQTFENNDTQSIPDDDYEGVESTIEIDADGNVGELTLDVEIEHSYRGDIAILLYKEGTRTVVYKGWTVDEPWKDDVTLTGKKVEGFGGLSASGTWKLRVVDIGSPDSGALKNWAITPRLE